MKVALVSGSSRGIGRGIADLLHDNGYTVVYCGTRSERPADLPEDRPYHRLNIAESEQRKAIIDWVIATYGRLDVLVNNAGVAPLERRDILEMTEESFDRVTGVNLKGTMFMCQQAARAMIEGKKTLDEDYQPRIVNIGSMSAYTSSTSRGEYCISKAGVGMVTKLIDEGLLPVRRFGKPVDVAKMVLACCSGLLDYSAGQVLDADGGFALRRL